MEEPIGKYNYVVECLKSDKIPEFRVTFKPNLSQISELRGSIGVPKSRGSTGNFSTGSLHIPLGQMLRATPVFEEKKQTIPSSYNTNPIFKTDKKLIIPTDKSI